MAWLIGIATYALLLVVVAVIASGSRRSDLRHAAAVYEFDEIEPLGPIRVSPKRAHAGLRSIGKVAADAALRRRLS